jgi:chromosome segregation ATPase
VLCCWQQAQQLQEQLQAATAERDGAQAQAAQAQADAAALQQQLQEAAQQLADARQQLADAAESKDLVQQQLHSLQAALQDMATEKDAAFTRLGGCSRWSALSCVCWHGTQMHTQLQHVLQFLRLCISERTHWTT